MPASRSSDLCLGLQDDSVFVDFSKNQEGVLTLIRISYDGYGCNKPVERITPLDAESSRQLIEASENESINSPRIHSILMEYFYQHKTTLWEDALKDHSLIK